ncbi:S8 family serine peptidase [Sutcliffiella horikoshii]|uniref:S8 family serine peptidase n=1 Tax=Sutcliffiella horikoshii TaxID=79883 RepID=A0AA94WQ59_9BACI|nr:S8 family serine peptidase [Sutcliffiella horikoshii]TYS58613.1 S8 family serine peptidase [Sutcliffiella horikoshii]
MRKLTLKTFFIAVIAVFMLATSLFQGQALGANTKSTTTNEPTIIHDQLGTGETKITLITGDIVHVTSLPSGQSVINVEPAENNGDGIRVITVGEDTYVYPNAAMPYLAEGKLDHNLFNITKLVEYQFDDTNSSTVPVIVEYQETKAKAASTKAAPKGAKKQRELKSINAAALETNKDEATTFWNDVQSKKTDKSKPESVQLNYAIEKIWLDAKVEATLHESVPQIGTHTAWEAGLTGEGIKVAVLDSGIDSTHPDIAPQLDEAISFVPGEEVQDKNGHGTHVASTILGTGAASEGQHKGVAPDARLLVGKVLGDNGSGLASWIIEGMEWAAQNADVVNMSLGSTVGSDGTDPMAQAVNTLTEEHGTLFVIAAGNAGAEGSVGSPGAADAALTIGAVDKNDQLAWFSSKGPRLGDMALKPDVSAPGVGIMAARSQYSSGTGSYKSLNGTSMATPHVAGAVAILLQQNPEATPQELKETLMNTAKKLPNYQPYHIGTGRIDIVKALNTDIRATGSVSFGFFQWPHDEAAPVDKTVTYTNESDQDITLDLEATFADANGKSAPEGMLTLAQTSVTVPANGTADVKVTVDPAHGESGQRYQGHLTASSNGEAVVHTTMATIKEDERYTLTLNATDRDGSPALAYVVMFNETMLPEAIAVPGTRELRLKKGTYSVMSMMDVDVNTDHKGVALVGEPEVVLDGPKTVELDARKANEITVKVPKKTEPMYQRMEYYQTMGTGTVHSVYLMPVWIDKLYAAPTKKTKLGEFEFLTRWRLIKPYLTMNYKGKELDEIVMPGSTLLEGKHNLKAIYAGEGSQADYDRLNAKGKAVVVDRSKTISEAEQAAAAVAAGAKLLIIANYEDVEFNVSVGQVPLTAAAISKSEGDKLIKAVRSGNVKLQVEGTKDSPYAYDLVDVHQENVPKKLAYSPKNKELAVIETNYNSHLETDGGEFRFDMRPYTKRAIGFQYKISFPTTRTEYVSATKDTYWYHQATVLDETWQIRQPLVVYEKGQKLVENWFSPVVRPALGDGYWAPKRQGNSLQINVPALADAGTGNTGGTDYDISVQNQTTKLFQGDTLIREGKGQAVNGFGVLTDELQEFRVVTEAKRDPERWNTSTRTNTEWIFKAKEEIEPWQSPLPFLTLNYGVDTDVNGDALLNRPTQLQLSVEKVKDAIGYGNVDGATLEVSFNEGKKWKKVKLNRNGDMFTASITNPKSAKSVSLKASAWDDQGNKITQEIIKAYGLR